MNGLLLQLQKDFPGLRFEESNNFLWSPKQQKIHYVLRKNTFKSDKWSLLHELAHAILDHKSYPSDFGLLKIELAAWQKAQQLAENYDCPIDQGHIDKCLDTYRDWLYQRSTCPTCTSCSLQIDSRTYNCFNCGTTWHVSSSRMCRAYRRTQKETLAHR